MVFLAEDLSVTQRVISALPKRLFVIHFDRALVASRQLTRPVCTLASLLLDAL
jgi:hypothetical protein